MRKIIIATKNKGKLKEFKQMLGDGFEVVSLPYGGYDGEVEETGSTFFENALLKARAVYNATGVTALADDSGLCVNALGGAPGVLSARYGGDISQKQKNALLLGELEGKEDRSAYFECALVMYGEGGIIATGCGRVEGYISLCEEGEGGFGYDPIFISKELNKSFGLADESEKNAISHRGRAIKDLILKL